MAVKYLFLVCAFMVGKNEASVMVIMKSDESGLLVMFSCHFKFPQKDISISQVAVSPSLRRTVTKLLCYEQTLNKEIQLHFIIA